MSMERIGPINRRQALKRVGALAVPVLSGYHPLVPVQEGGAAWEPRFFNTREAELVAELSEHIIRRLKKIAGALGSGGCTRAKEATAALLCSGRLRKCLDAFAFNTREHRASKKSML